MRVGNFLDAQDHALSVLGWWNLAGVDVLVDETPRDWLAPPSPRPAAATPIPDLPAALPETLEAMRALFAADPRFGEGGARVLPLGDAADGLMILGDVPDLEDAAQGAPFAGAAGRLLGNMLAAIGYPRDAGYRATLTPLRPIAGKLAPPDEAAFGALALHHLALARPRVAVLFGEATSRAVLGIELAKARGRLHLINHEGARLKALATYHPRTLLGRAAFKAAVWADLRLLLGEVS